MSDGAEHGVLEIEKVNADHRGLDIVPVNDFRLDEVSYLAEFQAFDVQGAENGELDVPVIVNPVAGSIAVRGCRDLAIL